jgi:tetratricopeptide (TPR) repeat protein
MARTRPKSGCTTSSRQVPADQSTAARNAGGQFGGSAARAGCVIVRKWLLVIDDTARGSSLDPLARNRNENQKSVVILAHAPRGLRRNLDTHGRVNGGVEMIVLETETCSGLPALVSGAYSGHRDRARDARQSLTHPDAARRGASPDATARSLLQLSKRHPRRTCRDGRGNTAGCTGGRLWRRSRRRYRAFRELFAARRFAEALPAAQQVVDITEQKFGKESLELAKPLVNLGTTKHRLADFNGAASQYQRALKIVETHEGGFSRGVIQPLLGLGVTYAAAGDYEASARSLRRAVDVSRKLDGLFNPEQLELVEPLVASYVELGQYEDAEREQQYAVRLAEARYGKYDPRLIPTLEYNASWLEKTGRYIAARQSYARALDIARRAGGKQDLRMVTPLRGIARMYRMEYLYGPGIVEADEPAANPQAGTGYYGAPSPGSTPTSTVLNDAGENALRLALEVLDAHPEEAIALRGDTLVDLGDWYMVAGRARDATREYRNAWVALSAPGAAGTAIFGAPVQLIYRPPSAPSAIRRRPEEYRSTSSTSADGDT